MAIKDLLPWNRSSEKNEIVPHRNQTKEELSLVDQTWPQWMNEFWANRMGWPFTDESWMAASSFSPDFDLSESETEIRISADVPGLTAKDIQISLDANHLVISGEKKMEKKEKEVAYTRIGRVYGAFQQRIPIAAGQIDENQIKATYKDGVLDIRLPKKEKDRVKSKKIPIKST
jgi:HSP20 family protein